MTRSRLRVIVSRDPARGLAISRARALVLAIGLGAAAALVSGCAPIVNTRGNMVDPEKLAEIKPGTTTADDVLSVLGTPTSVGTFDTRTWYYIGQITESQAFLEPTVVDRRVVAISFEPTGKVREVRKIDPSQGKDIEMVDRATPTAGHEMGIIEQLLGNVGKFSPAQKNSRGPTSTPGSR